MIIINGGANDVSSMRTQTISAVGKWHILYRNTITLTS
jgi:hypothetical protein